MAYGTGRNVESGLGFEVRDDGGDSPLSDLFGPGEPRRPVPSLARGRFGPESGFRRIPGRAPTNRGTEANTMIITFLVAASYLSTAVIAGLFSSAASFLTFFLGLLQ